ncbi:hypothetical protein NFHSH190041_17940 [Shewanella sp. NFH-SH190041]|uniref:hypothetical protein n=1 Tax=Shewanella sp. NFH-SH190041 TaxID=2950245 RepID=UPI0021C4106D|nr:hypothetical protein [Shewanella sp. NFH-SH190041]BDM64342.1 hypothetical protein NFHSH190041_17940 [Shewanella sp. NFH-SH190041]
MKSEAELLLEKHDVLIHSEDKRVSSHTQRVDGEMFINTLMLEGYDTPFKYRRVKKYKSLVGQSVNLTYYADTEKVAGFEVEVMKVIRLRRC